MASPPRPATAAFATRRPWAVAGRVNGLILIRMAGAPYAEVAFVPINGNEPEAAATAELIAHYSRCDAAGVVP